VHVPTQNVTTSKMPVPKKPPSHIQLPRRDCPGGSSREGLFRGSSKEDRPGSSSMKGMFRGFSKEELSWRFFRGGNVQKFFQGGTVLEVFQRRNCPGGSSKEELSWRFFQGETVLEVLPRRNCPGGSSKEEMSWKFSQGGTVKDLVALQASRQLCQASAQLMGRSEYTNFSSHSSCCTLNRG